MASGRPMPWHAADTTIRELYGLPEPTGPSSRPSVLLSHGSFRALFDAVPPDAYLSDMAVAIYLGVSKLTIERKLGEAFGGPDHSWRSALAIHLSGDGPAMVNLRLRWSFVISELEPVLHVEKKRTAVRRQDLQLRKKSLADKSPARGFCAVADALQFVVDSAGRLVGALGQGSMSAGVFIDTLNNGGAIVKLDPVSALGLAWSDSMARTAWDAAIRDVLAAHVDSILSQLDNGAEATGKNRVDGASRTYVFPRRKHSHV